MPNSNAFQNEVSSRYSDDLYEFDTITIDNAIDVSLYDINNRRERKNRDATILRCDFKSIDLGRIVERPRPK